MPEVVATFEGRSIKPLFSFHPDEASFLLPSHSSLLPEDVTRAVSPFPGPTDTRRFVASVVREYTVEISAVDCPSTMSASGARLSEPKVGPQSAHRGIRTRSGRRTRRSTGASGGDGRLARVIGGA